MDELFFIMARAETVTLLSLDIYSSIMRIYAPHFNQLQGNKAPKIGGCTDEIWDQDAREDLAWTMAQAEEMIAIQLGYYPSPKFITDENIPFALPGIRSDWRNAEIEAEWSEVECFGTETLTLATGGEGADVEYSDDDNDPYGREETATIGTDAGLYVNDLAACGSACEVAVFFREADGAEDSADPRWEIKPIKVDIDGATMKITAESSLFVKPELWDLTKRDSAGPGSQDTDRWEINFDTDNLVSQVDVYCRTVNQQTPVTLLWDGVCNCIGICQHKTQLACAYQTDKKRGFFIPRPATWNGTTNIETAPTNFFPPESVTVNYRAGLAVNRRTCRMNPLLERAIVKLTNALLPEPPCGFCGPAETRWKSDRKTVDPITLEAANMPWDLYTQGALDAWKIVKMKARGHGGKMGRGYR